MKCNRCLSSKKPAAPMLQNATWMMLARQHETLCAECAFGRAIKRHINLTFDDLLPCVFNLEANWFDWFRARESSEKSVSCERAYAWQHAMFVRSTQKLMGLPPQDIANAGKILATDSNGTMLREAPEGGIYGSDEVDWDGGDKYLKVYRSDGALEAEIFICFEGENSARIREIFGVRGPGSLGNGKVRSVFRLLQLAFPDVETVAGYRTTGVRWNKPAQLKKELRRICGAFTPQAPSDPSNPLVINQYGTPGPVSSHPLGGLY